VVGVRWTLRAGERGRKVTTGLIVEGEVRRAIDQYFGQVDSTLPGLVEGFYLVGSLALHDYIAGISDIDFVAVSSRELSESELQTLTGIHRRLAKTIACPQFDGIYATWAVLSSSSRNARVHHWLDGTMQRESKYAANPVTWATLRRYPLAIRGSSNPEVFDSDLELRDWCKANVQSYWTNWVRSSRKLGVHFIASFTWQAACWGVLGVVRLHATIKTGRIISKTQACEYGCEVFPREWQDILRLALHVRQRIAPKKTGSVLERRAKTLRFMEYVIADAIGLMKTKEET